MGHFSGAAKNKKQEPQKKKVHGNLNMSTKARTWNVLTMNISPLVERKITYHGQAAMWQSH
jgi:hypothetical protein